MGRISLAEASASLVVSVSVMLSLSNNAAAQVCDPYQVTFQVNRPPNNPVALALDFLVQSSCNVRGEFPARPSCGFETTVTVDIGTTAAQKCELLVENIEATCSALTGGFFVDDNCAIDQSFTVADSFCQDHGQGGLMVGIANSSQLLTAHNHSGFVFGDYEFDTITPGCPSVGNGHAAILGGTATGVPILAGETQGSVSAVINFTAHSGTGVEVDHPTVAGETPEQIVAALVSVLNARLPGDVRCSTAPNSARVLQCGDSAPGGTGPIALILQSDDTGLQKGVVAGPAADVQRVVMAVDTRNAPLFQNFPPPPPPAIPAAGGAMLVAFTLLLGVIGLWTVGGRARGARRGPGGHAGA
jgi:hypothetical protein